MVYTWITGIHPECLYKVVEDCDTLKVSICPDDDNLNTTTFYLEFNLLLARPFCFTALEAFDPASYPPAVWEEWTLWFPVGRVGVVEDGWSMPECSLSLNHLIAPSRTWHCPQAACRTETEVLSYDWESET